MKPADLAELLLLAAIWGASFLFMRIGAGEFGPVALIAVRVGGAALLLLPLLALRGQMGELRRHWRPIAVVGLTNSVLPFLGFAYAALTIPTGLSAVFNAAAPLFGAAIAWWWLGDRLNRARVVGLLIGFGGVAGLAIVKSGGAGAFRAGGSGWAIVACLGAALAYGWSANYTKRRLVGVAPMAVAAGSQLAATLVLALPALLWWPAVAPSPRSWIAASLLALLCTGLAYLLYFRLIAHAGPQNAIAVTYLLPVFATVWGALLLGEMPTAAMAIGCAVILLGTSLATGLLDPSRLAAQRIGRPT